MQSILIIDDDAAIGNLEQEVLERAGYAVLLAYSGTEAQLLLKNVRPNLILLDLMLPGLSGEALLPQVKNIPVIVISAKAMVQDKVNLLLGGGDMNGIVLLVPEWAARSGFGVLLLVNGLVFWKRVLPVYSRSFSDKEAAV